MYLQLTVLMHTRALLNSLCVCLANNNSNNAVCCCHMSLSLLPPKTFPVFCCLRLSVAVLSKVLLEITDIDSDNDADAGVVAVARMVWRWSWAHQRGRDLLRQQAVLPSCVYITATTIEMLVSDSLCYWCSLIDSWKRFRMTIDDSSLHFVVVWLLVTQKYFITYLL